MTAIRYGDIGEQYFLASGDPNAGGELWFLDSTSGDEIITYYDQATTIPNTNPVILDAAGRQPDIWIPDDEDYEVVPIPPPTPGPPPACVPYACDALYNGIMALDPPPWGYWPMDDSVPGGGTGLPTGGVAASALEGVPGAFDLDATQGTGAIAGQTSLMSDSCVGVTAMDIDGSTLHWPNGGYEHLGVQISIAAAVKPTNSLAGITVSHRYNPVSASSIAEFQVRVKPGEVSIVYASESGTPQKVLTLANGSIAPIGTESFIIVKVDTAKNGAPDYAGLVVYSELGEIGSTVFEPGELPMASSGAIGPVFAPSFIFSGDVVQHVVVNLEPWTAEQVTALQLAYARNDATYTLPAYCPT